MKTYLLTWNPSYKGADGERWLKEIVGALRRRRICTDRWSTGMSRSISRGDLVFLLRQGNDHPGLIGAGYVTAGPFRRSHWQRDKRRAKKKANYVNVNWTSMVMAKHVLVRERLLSDGLLSASLVNSQQSGREIPAPGILANAWDRHLAQLQLPNVTSEEQKGVGNAPALRFADQFTPSLGKPPRMRKVTSNVYVRSRRIRYTVLERSEGKCESCGKLGFLLPDGRLFIETHHIVSLAEGGRDHERNVIALCPNEHREAHHGTRATQLRKRFQAKVTQKYLACPRFQGVPT